jgi:hypothetical protein
MARNIWSFRIALFATGSLSITSLLFYFLGVSSFFRLAVILSTVEVLALVALFYWAQRSSWYEAKRLLSAGLWAGCLATLVYDIIRIPIVHAGMPVFKAISYFGTVFMAVDRPSWSSEFFGWAYHFSNGVSFALMYAAIAVRPKAITGVLWGLSLEGVMLLTPYAEVFGYQRDVRFMTITIGSHIAYGLVLWLALIKPPFPSTPFRAGRMAASVLAILLGLALTAADSNRLYARKIPLSPPPYIGPHLYTVWNLPEVDRMAVIWIVKRFVDQDAVFNLIEPFDKVKVGKPLDMPESNIRRSATRSATEVLISQRGLNVPKLRELAGITRMTEIAPWLLVADPNAQQFADHFRQMAATNCGRRVTSACLPIMLRDLDSWYSAAK